MLWVTPPVVVLRIKGNNDNSYFLRICPLDTNTALVPIQVRHTNPLKYFHGAIQTDSLTTTLCPSLWSKAPCKLPLRHALSDLPYPTTPTSQPASQPTNLPWRCAWEINNNKSNKLPIELNWWINCNCIWIFVFSASPLCGPQLPLSSSVAMCCLPCSVGGWIVVVCVLNGRLDATAAAAFVEQLLIVFRLRVCVDSWIVVYTMTTTMMIDMVRQPYAWRSPVAGSVASHPQSSGGARARAIS